MVSTKMAVFVEIIHNMMCVSWAKAWLAVVSVSRVVLHHDAVNLSSLPYAAPDSCRQAPRTIP